MSSSETGGGSRIPGGGRYLFVWGALAAALGSDVGPEDVRQQFTAFFSGSWRESIQQVIENWLIDVLINPIVTTVLDSARTVIDGVLFIAFGGDRSPFTTEGTLGVLDVPIYIAQGAAGLVLDASAGVVSLTESFNTAIADLAASAGLAALPIVSVLAIAELGIALYVTYLLLRAGSGIVENWVPGGSLLTLARQQVTGLANRLRGN